MGWRRWLSSLEYWEYWPFFLGPQFYFKKTHDSQPLVNSAPAELTPSSGVTYMLIMASLAIHMYVYMCICTHTHSLTHTHAHAYR